MVTQKKAKNIFFLFLLLLLASCTQRPYRDCEVVGADEFVMDSYRIREGKMSILEMEGKTLGTLPADVCAPYPDTIQEGDLLNIVFVHPTRSDLNALMKELSASGGFRVCGGKIHLPQFDSVEVIGLSLEEAKALLQSRYREQIADVEIFISYKERVERKVELLGLVKTPCVCVDGKMRLFELLSLAQIAPDANLFRSYVARGNNLLPVDLQRLVKEGDMSQNIVMRGGDKVYIAEGSSAYVVVLGEVGREQLIPLPNGFMPLRQALGAAGGIPFTGDRSYIQIIRGNLVCPKIYTLHWSHVLRLPTNSLLLMPGDIVYIAATPIAQWSRFVSQILPTLVGLDLFMKNKSVGVVVP
jgi:polysaccharide biosynthesis/export protein